MNKKVIVSNKSVLQALYGNKFEMVKSALNTIVGSDQRRCIKTEIIYLDDKEDMDKIGVAPVTSSHDEKQNKDAIDGIYNALKPDYLTILGAPDVIPHQTMDNPVKASYEDPNVPSDLPYACDAAYSKKIADFTNPSRVVGRISGIKGNNNPDVLIKAINTSSALQKRKRDEYDKYFAVSAKVWQGSSTTSVKNIFGNASLLQLSPPSGPDWSNDQLAAKAHFVNCHGSDNNPHWFGQDGSSYPVAVSATQIAGKILPGTIATAECCYGAQLYPGWSVCISYIASNCCAFCGSTNIAYGPASGQGQADLMTQYFLMFLLAEDSAGSALLAARQKYIRECHPLNSVDLKTIGQFILLGDASSHPVGTPPSIESKIASIYSADNNQVTKCLEKRRRFKAEATALKESVGLAIPDEKLVPTGEIKSVIDKLITSLELKDTQTQSATIKGGSIFASAQKSITGPEKIHIISGLIDKTHEGVYNATAIIVKEEQGKVVSIETLNVK